MPVPQEFFTAQSMTTLAGATGITYVVANGVQVAFDFNPKWLALAIAIVVCLLGAITSGTAKTPVDYLVSVFDGFLVFMTARGATVTTGRQPQQATPLSASGGPVHTKRRFNSHW